MSSNASAEKMRSSCVGCPGRGCESRHLLAHTGMRVGSRMDTMLVLTSLKITSPACPDLRRFTFWSPFKAWPSGSVEIVAHLNGSAEICGPTVYTFL